MKKKLGSIFKNYYFITGFCFIIWMVFVDSNDLISRFKMSSRLQSLYREKEYYLEKINEVKNDRNELLNNPELLEKYAREKYLMKKESEDIYVVVTE